MYICIYACADKDQCLQFGRRYARMHLHLPVSITCHACTCCSKHHMCLVLSPVSLLLTTFNTDKVPRVVPQSTTRQASRVHICSEIIPRLKHTYKLTLHVFSSTSLDSPRIVITFHTNVSNILRYGPVEHRWRGVLCSAPFTELHCCW